MKFLLSFLRFLISLRYKIKLEGAYRLEHNGPILILPNHVALVDPGILMCFLSKYINLSPVASEKYYNKPIFKQFMDLFGTIPIGDIKGGADFNEIEKIFEKVTTKLRSGRNILIYPSGQIYRQGFESIIGKQATYNIVNLMPSDTKVIGIKTRGLWGSMFSMVWDNGKTPLVKLFFFSFFLLFANLFFFLPKREVNIEIEDLTLDIKKYKNKNLDEFNNFLQDFYNKDGEEKNKYLKHYFYFNDVRNRKIPEIITGSLKELEKTQKYDLRKISDEIKSKIKKEIIKIKDIKTEINYDSRLILDLYFDSLDLAEIKSYIQSNFVGASNPPIGDLKTVGDLLIMAVGKSKTEEELKKCNWGDFPSKTINLINKIS